VLLQKEEALAMVNDRLQEARAALAEAQTTVAEKETALITAQTQLQQDRTTLEGCDSGRLRPSRRPGRPRS
jgi:hypothetical protein